MPRGGIRAQRRDSSEPTTRLCTSRSSSTASLQGSSEGTERLELLCRSGGRATVFTPWCSRQSSCHGTRLLACSAYRRPRRRSFPTTARTRAGDACKARVLPRWDETDTRIKEDEHCRCAEIAAYPCRHSPPSVVRPYGSQYHETHRALCSRVYLAGRLRAARSPR